MDQEAMKEPAASTPVWDELEEWTRGRIQEWMQQLLVEEVTEFLGRAKHQRRGVDMQGYRNGYGKPRRLTMRSGTVTVRRPRLRDLDERLEYGYERVAELIDENGEQMVAFYRFPRGHWRHLRTSNVVESPFAALRLRTDAPKRFKKVANATAVVWKTGLIVVGLKSLMFLGNSALMHRCMGANLHLSSGSFVQVREVSDRDSTLRKLGDDVQLPTQRLDVGTEVRDIHVSAPLQLGHRWLVHVQRLANRLLGHSPCLTQLVEGHCRTQLRFPTINAPAALRREVFRQLVESMSSTHMINPSCRNSSRCSS